MKKILLSTTLIVSAMMANAQVVLNEVYTDPGNNKHEFFELYNSSNSGSENLDCYTLVTFWEANPNKGFYVIDLPNLSIPSKGYFTGSAQTLFNYQGSSGTANFSWNDPVFLAANNGFLRSYQVNGPGYNAPTTPANLQDLFTYYNPNGGGQICLVLLFKNGTFINGVRLSGANGVLTNYITSLPDLSIDMSGSCQDFTIDFGTLPVMEFVNQQAGSDNGYARKFDGKCGAWDKTSNQVNHTPNAANGSAASLPGELTTTELINCGVLVNGKYVNRVNFDITAVSGDATELTDFPVQVQLYYDYTPSVNPPGYLRQPNGVLDGIDSTSPTLVQTFNTIAEAGKFLDVRQGAYVILVYKTARGCFDKVQPVANTCAPLPVDFKSFTATRNRSSVVLKWETASEKNNSGFAVERNNNGTWEQIAFVNSQAAGGNSDALLSYTYNDLNNSKGITQYRIKQVDLDNKSKYSEIRSVRGLDQIGKVTVYPNPTSNGTVNVVFDDASVNRTISVIDMSGRTLKQINNVSTNNITIDNLQPGMYTLRIMVPETGEQNVQKIVVNKR